MGPVPKGTACFSVPALVVHTKPHRLISLRGYPGGAVVAFRVKEPPSGLEPET